MRSQFATTTLTRTITVADGVFAPGHLGELTQHLPFELVDAVLEETGTTQRRLRDLPSRVGVYFLLGLGLFPHLGYAKVWSKLVAGLGGLRIPTPSEKALRDLRRRLGPAPLKALFEVVSGPLAQPHTPGVRYRCWRTVAFDGCSSLKIPDTERNRSWFGKIKYRQAWAGYPTLILMTLVETGTRGLIGATFGSTAMGETAYARQLLHLLRSDMLVLTDRGFDSDDFLTALADTGAQLLARCTATRRPLVAVQLPDGSYLSVIAGLKVRIIDADVTLTTADGQQVSGRYRLITTLLDHRRDPAERLIRLYHERWEIESAYLALRHTLLRGHVLRSGDPIGIAQEMWALLTVYQLLRMAMTSAVETLPGTDPDRACFTTALESARDQVITARGVLPPEATNLIGIIGQAVLADLLPKRRMRISIRKVKSPISRYHTARTDDRPLTSTKVIEIAFTIHEGRSAPPLLAPHPRGSWARDLHQAEAVRPTTRKKQKGAPRLGRREHVLALLQTDPHRSWDGREVGQLLGITNLHSFCVQMAQWAREGVIHKASPSIYRLA
ncbi:MAG: IS4 family transposase [Longispora sp.]|nr:IS4 family transposase [Longispora sp. (in: high G+C Gram-positive bacteria)]